MMNYASFIEKNMIHLAITKAQLISFDIWNMRYPSSKFSKALFIEKLYSY